MLKSTYKQQAMWDFRGTRGAYNGMSKAPWNRPGLNLA